MNLFQNYKYIHKYFIRNRRNLEYIHNIHYICGSKQVILHMKLRIKELAKEQNYPLECVASRLNISPVSLSQSLNGNPTLKRLEEVADAFGVDVSELFERPKKKEIHGCIYIDGEPHLIKDKWGLKRILMELEKEGE